MGTMSSMISSRLSSSATENLSPLLPFAMMRGGCSKINSEEDCQNDATLTRRMEMELCGFLVPPESDSSYVIVHTISVGTGHKHKH